MEIALTPTSTPRTVRRSARAPCFGRSRRAGRSLAEQADRRGRRGRQAQRGQATGRKADVAERVEALVDGELRDGRHPRFWPGASSLRAPPSFAGPRAWPALHVRGHSLDRGASLVRGGYLVRGIASLERVNTRRVGRGEGSRALVPMDGRAVQPTPTGRANCPLPILSRRSRIRMRGSAIAKIPQAVRFAAGSL